MEYPGIMQYYYSVIFNILQNFATKYLFPCLNCDIQSCQHVGLSRQFFFLECWQGLSPKHRISATAYTYKIVFFVRLLYGINSLFDVLLQRTAFIMKKNFFLMKTSSSFFFY